MKWNKNNNTTNNNNTCACFQEDKDTKYKHVFSFTNNKHLCWHKERICLLGGGHIAPPHICSSGAQH